MDANQYQTKTRDTAHAPFWVVNAGRAVRAFYWAGCAAGEVGELVNLLKKLSAHGHVVDSAALRSEVGDVLWYLARVCDEFDISLEDVMIGNVLKLEVRYPKGYSDEASIARVDVIHVPPKD